MDNGQYIMGPEVKAFEEEVARYVGVKHAIGVANGTDALFLALDGRESGAGDEVITTPLPFSPLPKRFLSRVRPRYLWTSTRKLTTSMSNKSKRKNQ